MSERMEVIALGIKLGTASGWDQVTDWGLTFYDYKSNLTGIPEGDLYIDFETGSLQITDESNTVLMDVPAYGFLKQTVENT